MAMPTLKNVRYEERGGVAALTGNGPDELSAIRVGTYEAISDAIPHAGWSKDVGIIVLTGAGGRAFCAGGDTSAATPVRQGRGRIGVEQLHGAIGGPPKLVIAIVGGSGIGGNAFAALCNRAIASESAQFGQVSPKVGSLGGRAFRPKRKPKFR